MKIDIFFQTHSEIFINSIRPNDAYVLKILAIIGSDAPLGTYFMSTSMR